MLMASGEKSDSILDWLVSEAKTKNPEISQDFDCLPMIFDHLKKKSEDAKKYLDWADGKRFLKCVRAGVASSVLDKGYSADLIDVGIKTRGPDDEIYDRSEEIRKKVARGNTILELHGHSGGKVTYHFALRGLPKFTGGLGDDDDRESGDDATWMKYFTKPIEEATRVLCLRKANGEAGHLSCIQIGSKYYLLCGSKNVHLVIRNRDDIEKYLDGRFLYAKFVAHAVMDEMEKMSESNKQKLFAFMTTLGLTAVFELLQPEHQHVEDLSYLDKPQLQFITWTGKTIDDKAESLCAIPPHIAIEIARVFGFQTVQYDIIGTDAVDARMRQIRTGYQYEGEVLYFLDANDNTIGLLKKKTVWYVVIRAIREKSRAAAGNQAKKGSDFSTSEAVRKADTRLKQIQKWLNFDDKTLEEWRKLGIGFIKWMLHETTIKQVTLNEVADVFPRVWKKYLASEEGLSDHVVPSFTNDAAS